MSESDFVGQLSSACEKGRDAARLAVRRWATTGKVPSSVGVAGFVLSNALSVAQTRLGFVNPPSKIKAVLSGPPWSEDIATEIVDTIFDATEQRALDEWIREEADYAYKEWEKGFREYYEGPDH